MWRIGQSLIDKTEGYRLPVDHWLHFPWPRCWRAFFGPPSAVTQPWSVGLIVVFIAGSWAIEVLLARSKVGLRIKLAAH